MKVLVGSVALLLVCGCGRMERDDAKVVDENMPQAGSPGAAPTRVGPIDVSAQPPDLPMACADRDALALELPCLVGSNLAGSPTAAGNHAVECKLAGDSTGVAIAFTLPLSTLPEHLGERLHFPFDGTTPIPSLGTVIGAERFAGTLSGVMTFSQVDLDGRAFVASLEEGRIQWAGDAGTSFTCSTIDGPMWAVAGNFL